MQSAARNADRHAVMSDGTRIAYCVEGSGPALVLTNGLTTSTTFWKYLLPIWSKQYTVMTWDLPGHGGSGPAITAASATVQAQPSMIARMMDESGIDRAFQVGWSTGSQIVLETYRQFPERCIGLGLLLGPAGHALKTTRLPIAGDVMQALICRTPSSAFAPICRLLARAMHTDPGHALGRSLGLIGRHVGSQDLREITRHLGSLDPTTLQRLVCSSATHSAHDVLVRSNVPILIVAGDQDPFAPSDFVGIPIHHAAPSSELIRLAEGTHTALLEQPALIAAAVADFMARTLTLSVR
jgi:pimeloyl-ACP methyl ester carboxylesterase